MSGEGAKKTKPIRMRVVGTVCGTLAILLSLLAIALLSRVFDANQQSLNVHSRYAECSQAASDLLRFSDYLTNQSREFVVTGNREALDAYFEEVYVSNHRSESVKMLNADFGGTVAYTYLFNANAESQSLSRREVYAMRLSADARGITNLPEHLKEVVIREKDKELSAAKKLERAEELVLGDQYRIGKDIILTQTNLCTSALLEQIQKAEKEGNAHLTKLLGLLRTIVLLLLAIVLLTLVLHSHLLISPMVAYANSIRKGKPLDLIGAHELRQVAVAYNTMYEENRRKTDLLKHEAEHDALTDLLNRGSYDRLLDADNEDSALLLVDIDRFKEINDEYGHECGDKVLQKVATSLLAAFASQGHVCRIGGDEFAVIVLDVLPTDYLMITRRIESAKDALRVATADVPAITLSCGVAFRAAVDGGRDNLYRAADEALYEVKRRGRDGIVFYEDVSCGM